MPSLLVSPSAPVTVKAGAGSKQELGLTQQGAQDWGDPVPECLCIHPASLFFSLDNHSFC